LLTKTITDGVRVKRVCSGCGWSELTNFSTQPIIVGVTDRGEPILEEVHNQRCDTCIGEGRKPNKLFTESGGVISTNKLNGVARARKNAKAAIEKERKRRK